MKKLTVTLAALIAISFLSLTGCRSVNVRDSDLACAVSNLVVDRCAKGEEASVEVCNIARLLAAKCTPDESKAKLFDRLNKATAEK